MLHGNKVLRKPGKRDLGINQGAFLAPFLSIFCILGSLLGHFWPRRPFGDAFFRMRNFDQKKVMRAIKTVWEPAPECPLRNTPGSRIQPSWPRTPPGPGPRVQEPGPRTLPGPGPRVQDHRTGLQDPLNGTDHALALKARWRIWQCPVLMLRSGVWSVT